MSAAGSIGAVRKLRSQILCGEFFSTKYFVFEVAAPIIKLSASNRNLERCRKKLYIHPALWFEWTLVVERIGAQLPGIFANSTF